MHSKSTQAVQVASAQCTFFMWPISSHAMQGTPTYKARGLIHAMFDNARRVIKAPSSFDKSFLKKHRTTRRPHCYKAPSHGLAPR